MIQMDQIQLTSQTPSHVEITKMLSTNQPEIRVIGSLEKKREFLLLGV